MNVGAGGELGNCPGLHPDINRHKVKRRKIILCSLALKFHLNLSSVRNHFIHSESILSDPYQPVDWNRVVGVSEKPIEHFVPTGCKNVGPLWGIIGTSSRG